MSNFSTKRWQAAEDALGAPVLSNQVQFSLLASKPASSQVRHAQDHGRMVIAYSPLAKGLLGGRYDVDSLPTGSARRTDPLWLPENVRRAMPVIETVRRIADAHGATPAQVALAWLISHRNVVVIPGASSVEQLRHNVGGGRPRAEGRRDRGADRRGRALRAVGQAGDRTRVRAGVAGTRLSTARRRPATGGPGPMIKEP